MRRCPDAADDFPQELAALPHQHGFAMVQWYGDWNLEPLSATSTSIIVVYRPRSADQLSV
jgi:hypothetical protein